MKRDQEMRELFTRWKNSSLTLLAFSKQEGVAYSKLLYWRRKLGDAVARRGSRPAKKASSPNLVPVRIIPEPAPSDLQPDPFEVWLTNGVSLNVTLGFDESELRRLVGVLSTC